MRWRALRPGELDHEALWLLVSLGIAAVGALWHLHSLPTPRCTWHEVTGFPCVSCGSTRCVRLLLDGSWAAAFAMNPLAFIALAGAALYDCYAATVLALRLPRLRLEKWPAGFGLALRIAIALALVANWAWLIARRV